MDQELRNENERLSRENERLRALINYQSAELERLHSGYERVEWARQQALLWILVLQQELSAISAPPPPLPITVQQPMAAAAMAVNEQQYPDWLASSSDSSNDGEGDLLTLADFDSIRQY